MANKTTSIQYTPEQKQAIYSTGHDILVSASAGSGKTFVLVQRVLNHLNYHQDTNHSNIAIDELLIVTFTEKAAHEMKERIEKQLKNKITTATSVDEKRYYLNQRLNLSDSYISTLHSFCKRLVDSHGYLINLTPNLKLISGEVESKLLKERVWDSLRSIIYTDDKYQPLIEQFLNENDDQYLKDVIIQLDNFAQVNPNVTEWYQQALQYYPKETDQTLEDTYVYKELLKPNLIEACELLKKESEYLYRQVPNSKDKAQEKWLELLETYSMRLDQMIMAIRGNRYTEAVDLFETPFPRKPALNKKIKEGEYSEEYLWLDESFKTFKDDFKNGNKPNFLDQTLYSDSNTQLSVFKKTKEIASLLIQVAQLFRDTYQQLKQTRYLMDFNDLEHYALAILSIDEVATYYKNHFKEVMIDEYQDTNPLQEKILSIIGEGKRFMVGDVKQSIYRFRLADPTLFLEKYETYHPIDQFNHTKGSNGEKIVLAENFRSRPEVIDSINLIFNQIMSKEFGEINYQDPSAQLVSGKYSSDNNPHYATELLLTLKEKEEKQSSIQAIEELESTNKEEDTTNERLNANQIMLEIKRLMDSKYMVKEEDSERELKYSDIVILVPTRTGNDTIEAVAKEHQIPIKIDQPSNYFKRSEVSLVLSFLKIIDNPLQDIPLVAVLRSPVFQFKEPELTLIRIANTSGFFYDALYDLYMKKGDQQALKELAQKGSVDFDQLMNKVDRLMKLLEQWRNQSRQITLLQLIHSLYHQTRLLERLSQLPNGLQRVANLNALPNYAKEFENYGFKGLYQFIQYIERMQSIDIDLESAELPEEQEDAIHVMTIHASKGLEFPVVFLTDTHRQFNLKDANQNVLMTAQKGIGLGYSDYQQLIKYESLYRVIIKQEIINQQKAEEMRKLYVAMTRAKEKLYLVGTIDQKTYEEYHATDWSLDVGYLPMSVRKGANAFLKWILPAFLAQGYSIRITQPTSDELQEINHPTVFNLKENLSDSEVERLSKIQNSLNTFKPVNYSNPLATKTTAFQSVSEIKQLQIDPDEYQLTPASFIEDQHINYYKTSLDYKPKFILQSNEDKNDLDPMQLGTLYHDFLKQLISCYVSEKFPEDFHSFFVTIYNQHELHHHITIAERDELVQYVQKYLLQYLKPDYQIEVEKQFSMVLPTHYLFKSSEHSQDDRIMVHGIIDLFVMTPDGIILIDYKTDGVPKTLLAQRIEKYRVQINTYALALEHAYKQPVIKKYLAFIRMNHLQSMH